MDEDKRRANALKYAKATLELEGFYLSKEQEQLVLDIVKGNISEEDFIKKAIELARSKSD